MNGLELWESVASIAASVAVLATVVLVWWQIHLQRRSVDTENRRFMRESISVVHATLQDPEFRDARRRLFQQGALDAHERISDTEKSDARFVLSTYGLLARLNTKAAISPDVLREYWRSTLLRDWSRLEEFVKAERDRSGNPRLFTATEELVKEWARDEG